MTSIRWFSKGQKCNLDLTAGASHARSAPSCGRGCGADLRGGHAGSLLPGRVCLSRCAVAAGRPSLGLARGCGAVRRGLGGCVGVSVRASLSRGCEEAPLGGVSGKYLTELTVEFRKAVRQSHPQPSCQPGAELGEELWCRFRAALPGVGALFLLRRWCCARGRSRRRTCARAWTHGAGSAPARRRVSWRAGRCRGAPGPTELSAPRPVALATTSITGVNIL